MRYKVQYGWINRQIGAIDRWYDWTHGLMQRNLSPSLPLPSGIYASEEDGYFADYLAADICRQEVTAAIIARDGPEEITWETRIVEVPDAV